MPKVNVDRNFSNDPSYRYKMPEVEIKAEGGGNGKRTILSNILDISNELKRTPGSIITYLSVDLACQNIVKERKYVLYGDFTKKTIQNKIYDYIDSFVLCQKCKNPETCFIMNSKNDICMKCDACSEISSLPTDNTSMKVTKQIISKLKDSLHGDKSI